MLQGYRCQLQPKLGGFPAPGVVQPVLHSDRGQGPQGFAVQHGVPGDEGLDDVRSAGDGDGTAPDVLCVVIQDNPAAVDHNHMLQEKGDLVDQMRGKHDGAGMLCEVFAQPVVENLPGHGVQPEVGLVEEGDVGARCQSEDHPAESWPRESFFNRRLTGRGNSSASEAANSASQWG